MRLLALCLALVPILTHAQGVARDGLPRSAEFMLMTYGGGGALSTYAALGGTVIGARPFQITRATLTVTSASGGGAGSTVATATDGTNTCTMTWACTVTNSGTPKTVAGSVANGTGSGCLFPPGAAIYWSVSTAGCTSTQPTAREVNAIGEHR